MLHRGSLFLLLLFALGCKGHFIEPDLPGTGEPPISNAALAVRFGGSGAELVGGAVTDAAGNSYLAGSFTESADFDPGSGITARTSLGGSDGFLAKYSDTGALLWVVQLGGTGAETVSALARDAAGNLYVGGSFTGSADFDPGPGFQVLNSVGADDGFVAKYSATGDLVWARRFGGTGSDAVNGLAVDGAGTSYAAGGFSGQAHALPAAGTPIVGDGNETDGFVLSFDAAGALRWAIPLGGPLADAADAIAVSSTAVVVAGSFRGSADFARNAAPVPLTAQGGADAFLASYSTAGLLQWARDIGGVGEESSTTGGVSLDPLGGIALLGTFTGAADFDGGTGTVARTSISPADLFLVRYDATGSFAALVTVGGQGTVIGAGALADADGSVLVTGAFSGALDFDPGAGMTSLASLAQAGATDAFVARYSAAGALLWVSRFGESNSVSERANSGTALALDPGFNVLVAGRFFGSPDFDPGPTSFRLTSIGGADAFLVKLTSAGALATVP